jgi:hypothetical protein
MKLVRLIKICLTETCRRLQVEKMQKLSNIFPVRNGLKQGGTLSPFLFNFASGYAIRRVRLNQDFLKFNGTHQLQVCADYVNILDGGIHTIMKSVEA